MPEVAVTLVGRIGQPPVLRTGSRGDWASFTVATNPRFRQGEGWADGPTSWFTVNADGDLAHHVVSSLIKGQQVIVHGTVSITDSSQQDGSRTRYVDVKASAIGPDLRWGTAQFVRAERRVGSNAAQQVGGAPSQAQQVEVPAQAQVPSGSGARPEPALQPGWGSPSLNAEVEVPF